ncbi:MAG: AAA family ATPase [Pseudanabaena sp.]|jgi:SpoVK/Ycf46/Vps4 family AAA+-type ATPase|uniref:stress-responsive protein Ycf46 n=1 Tax=Pseudanabaena mucicola TaxID=71190 RepID=UPI00257778D4|nr:AAA family ATPase [Pseudanabaena mucicola]MCA6586425.1 AAA family ATPase [Pseudanabaena sp. M051S1SP1A06QC]MCA6589669.1 AAA family ATPase [Pseudanabaena sp. M109S1SP1A06QC]MCA6596041.1 AAA family ATPase [Pseudanabaena sp. M046S1SP1A06QC]MCA6604725.1 AAA family ATPase [Pseudanabaena sp. M007S1SP1A06QC]MCA6612157.1 AAA family ATPase [Pseudanabaena sp. M158S2SP1A06QC]MCA6615977.1 AAA family ATPase [Pseudanabaena sp. M090S1SP1A06QC]MCA6622048.1 AAA family ATPase [Pseudanabaena sp. M165S2SP1A0
MQEQLSILIQAQYPLIYLNTPEEERAERAIATISQLKPVRRVFVWTSTRGIVEHGQATAAAQHNTESIQAALQWVIRADQKDPAIYIFKDAHPFFDHPVAVRFLRDAVANFKGTQKTIILMSPIQVIPVELEKDIVVLDFPLPDIKAIEEVLDQQLSQIRTKKISSETREKLVRAALGLTQDEAEKVYRKAQVTSGRLTEEEVAIVLSEKQQLIRRNGILEYIEDEEDLDAVGGLEELKHWLQQRSNAFSQRARNYGLPQPKGMLILGVPGCGKSLIAKTTARLWSLPLIRLDMGRVYDGSTVGKSEANLRNALKVAESISPMILFIDELDKAFAGGAGSADSDGGTSSRIFGTFLTWMQEKKSPVFVMATANRIEKLPGEFLRKGRFDELFFVDLPNSEERRDIFRIHLRKRRPDLERFDLEQLSKVSDGFSGAEIEQAVIAAMYEAFAQDREFTQLDIISAVKSTTPLSRTMTEQVAALRDWARMRARPAATSVAEYQRMEF